MTTLVTAPEVYIKTPGESRLYNFDFSALLLPGAVIDGSQTGTITSTPAGVGAATVQGTPVWQGNVLQVRISGGVDAENYALLVTGHDNAGNTLQFVGTLQVRAA